MPNGEEKAAVMRTTKVRTKLKGDNSWLQARSNPEPKDEEEKPWIKEVRASRVNGAPVETSPVSSPVKPTPSPSKPATESVSTKPESKPASSNGFSGKTNFIPKTTSDTYKKIAPHTLRPGSDSPSQTEGQISPEEQERRREAASSVLKKSAARQRSYVLSAAKKFEPADKSPVTSPVDISLSFVAKRVEVTDDDESSETEAAPPSSSSPTIPATTPVPARQPKPRTKLRTTVDVTADEAVVPTVEDTAPEPVKEAPPVVPIKEDTPVVTPEKDPFEDMKPGCTKVATPLTELDFEDVEQVCAEPEPDDSAVSGKDDAPQPDQAPVSPAPVSPAPVSPAPVSPAPLSPAPVSPPPVSAVTQDTEETHPEPEPSPNQSADTLTALSDTLISFDTRSTSLLDTPNESDVSDLAAPDSFKDEEPAVAEDEAGPVDVHTDDSDEQESTKVLSNCVEITDDLLSFNNGPEELVDPVPPSPGRWSQDLLSGPDSLSEPAMNSDSLDLLADDVIPIDTEAHSLSTEQEEEKQTDETAQETQSPTETVTVTTKTVIITDTSAEDSPEPWSSQVTTTSVTKSSLADPFDPYPIGTTSPNSSPDLLQPRSAHSINSMSSNALESLAEDVIPINTDTKSLSTDRSWRRKWETSTPQHTTTEKSQEAEPAGHGEDQQILVTFERKSTENDSPWDRWTSPTVYTTTTTTEEEEDEEEEEEEEEEESPEETEIQTVETISTSRETYSDPEPAMDRYSTLETEEENRVETPESEPKKGFVYVKEYVNTTEMSSHGVTDTDGGGSDYVTSSSSSYSYHSPSTYSRGSLSSPCTYCGELVGNDARITIEHLNINCHPACFKCGVCSKPMGDLLDNMFLHGGTVHCESCYSKALD